jgi:predicted transcriptional regulator
VAVEATTSDFLCVARLSVKDDEEARLVQLGQGIRAIRLAIGLSQEALADAAGIDRSQMSRIERGRRNVSFMNICRVAKALGKLPSEVIAAGGL